MQGPSNYQTHTNKQKRKNHITKKNFHRQPTFTSFCFVEERFYLGSPSESIWQIFRKTIFQSLLSPMLPMLNKNRINILLIVHHLTCCQPLRSHYCENQTCKLWKETWPTWEFLGPIVHGPMLAFLPMSRVLPLFHCSLSFHKWGALLNWSGWVWGPWDLRISPNFYSCFQ